MINSRASLLGANTSCRNHISIHRWAFSYPKLEILMCRKLPIYGWQEQDSGNHAGLEHSLKRRVLMSKVVLRVFCLPATEVDTNPSIFKQVHCY